IAGLRSRKCGSKDLPESDAVVQLELKRVGTLRERLQLFFPLVLNPRLNKLLREYATLEQEVVIGFEVIERLSEGTGHLRDSLCLLGRKLIQVFVDRLVRFNAVFDAVKARHELCGKREVRVARGIRSTELNALGFGVGARDRDPDRR